MSALSEKASTTIHLLRARAAAMKYQFAHDKRSDIFPFVNGSRFCWQGTARGSFRAHFKAQGRASPAAPATLVPPLPEPTGREEPVVGDGERNNAWSPPQTHVAVLL